MNADRGELALVLHSHMPYVAGFGTWPFGEEWLWEAVAMSYLRLLPSLERGPITVGLTPVLCDQLEAMRGEAGDRFLAYLRGVRGEVFATEAAAFERAGEPDLVAEVRRAGGDYESAAGAFESIGRDLLGAIGRAGAAGDAELWTSSATHAILPLLATEFGADLQMALGPLSHRRRFGGWDGGFWLPECAWGDHVAADLARHGVTAFCIDQTATWGRGADEHLAPVDPGGGGPVALPIDWEAVALVWEQGGYPANPPYRDTHRRTTLDLMPWTNAGGSYDEDAASAQARRDAEHFVAHVIDRLDRYRASAGRPGLVVCALDTELLGHWWYEGPWWLEAVFAAAQAAGLALTTPREALERHDSVRRALPVASWGHDKDLSTWDAPGVADMVWQARDAELRVMAMAHAPAAAGDAALRTARELLALQSSDWAFMRTRSLAGDYPDRRVAGHRRDLDAALAQALAPAGRPPLDPALGALAPDLDAALLLNLATSSVIGAPG